MATKIESYTYKDAIADGARCAPMTAGVQYWELEVVKNDTGGYYPGAWWFGVCRPGIDLNNGNAFFARGDTWMMLQQNDPDWTLNCKTCAGTGMTLRLQPRIPDGSRIGL